jgi:hypothetical protein
MFGLKKIVPALAAVIALSIPSLALADDHGRRDVRSTRDRDRDDHAVVELRAEIARDRVELQRDVRAHRWEDARREKRELERHEQQLRELTQGRR